MADGEGTVCAAPAVGLRGFGRGVCRRADVRQKTAADAASPALPEVLATIRWTRNASGDEPDCGVWRLGAKPDEPGVATDGGAQFAEYGVGGADVCDGRFVCDDFVKPENVAAAAGEV